MRVSPGVLSLALRMATSAQRDHETRSRRDGFINYSRMVEGVYSFIFVAFRLLIRFVKLSLFDISFSH